MDEKKRGVLIGIIIIAIGFLSLLSNLDLIPFGEDFFWAGLFLILTYACSYAYQKDRSRWWALIGAGICLFLSIVFIFEAIPFLPNDLIGVIFLWMIAAGFIFVYARNPDFWWTLIPAGTLLVIGVIVLVDSFNLLDDDLIPFILFLGLGLTFGFLYGIRNETNQLDWAKYPAVFLILFSFFLLIVTGASLVANLITPIALILVGGILIYRALQKNRMAGE